jgi:hypothetical protein
MSEDRVPQPPSPGKALGAMWLYSVLRFGLFFALWGLLWVARVPSLLAATIALILSIPLSYILLRKQRAQLAANLEARVAARQAQRRDIDAQLTGGPQLAGDPQLAEGAEDGRRPPSPVKRGPAAKRRPGAGGSGTNRSAQQ